MAYFHTTVLDNQIKALPTVGTASGSVATFDTDMTENLISCVCEVASGSSEINVYACGKNLFCNDLLSGAYSDANFTIPSTSTTQRSIKIWLFAGTYTISFGGGDTYRIIRLLLDGGYDAPYISNITEYTFTTTIDGYVGLSFRREDNSAWQDINIQIEKGSYVTNFEQYGNKYNVPFGETLSGNGSFDVLSGILTRADDTTKQLSANYIQTKNGLNNIWCDTNGDTSVKYILSVGKAIS